ncbi:hypothetical protein LXL04_025181 [Taraxacum kok-saghyz]
MNVNDLHKVWEIRTLKKKVGGDEARKFLEKIAKQVQPIMRKHKWRVKVLSEMCPKNPRLLGLNVGHGLHVKLRLRKPNTDWDFYPFDHVLDTMLHELCHNAIGPHNTSFYKLWDDLRKECEELMSKGILGSGNGFDLPGRRLGGMPRQPPLSSLRQTALIAAENRARQGQGHAKRVGGDKSIMSALTPVQAAAMAAERRLQDDIWCGLEELIEEEEETMVSSSNNANTHHKRCHSESSFVDLTVTSASDKRSRQKTIDLTTSSSTSIGSDIGWECVMCTLLNPDLAPVCEVCGTQKPKSVEEKYKTWSCKFCTLENNVKVEKCGACGEWRYSYGQPIATPSPNVGT